MIIDDRDGQLAPNCAESHINGERPWKHVTFKFHSTRFERGADLLAKAEPHSLPYNTSKPAEVLLLSISDSLLALPENGDRKHFFWPGPSNVAASELLVNDMVVDCLCKWNSRTVDLTSWVLMS